MPPPESPLRRLLLSVDMQKYSDKDNPGQFRAQVAFLGILETAAREAGLDRAMWIVQRAGDSELAILPPDVDETLVVGEFAEHLDGLSRDHNRGLADEAKVRLRMAVHEGLVHPDGPTGFPGDAANTVCRMRDARVLKDALVAFPDAGLALIVSEPIHRDIVAQQYRRIRKDRFRKVRVVHADKGFEADAWISVVGEDVRQVALPGASGQHAGDVERSSPVRRESYHVTTNEGTLAQGPGAIAIGTQNLYRGGGR